MKIHAGKEVYNCPICQKAYYQKHLMTNHMKSHKESELPFQLYIQVNLCRQECLIHRKGSAGKEVFHSSICHKAFYQKYSIMLLSRASVAPGSDKTQGQVITNLVIATYKNFKKKNGPYIRPVLTNTG